MSTCMVCAGTISEGDNCGMHPRLLLAALWGEGGTGRQERLQAAYLSAQVQSRSEMGWEARRFKMGAVHELLPWRVESRGDLAEALRQELHEGHTLAEAEIAAFLGMYELRKEMTGFTQEESLRATAQPRDLEIKASGGLEPSEISFLTAHEEFERGLEGNLDTAALGERLRPYLAKERSALALMLHCEIIDSNGEMFEGSKAVKAAELAAVLRLGELDEVVYLLSEQRYQQAQATLNAAGALARTAGGGQDGILDGEEV